MIAHVCCGLGGTSPELVCRYLRLLALPVMSQGEAVLWDIRFFPVEEDEPKFLGRNRSFRLRMGFLKTDPFVGQSCAENEGEISRLSRRDLPPGYEIIYRDDCAKEIAAVLPNLQVFRSAIARALDVARVDVIAMKLTAD